MKKTIIAALLAALVLINASAVLAGVSPYVEPISMTATGAGAYGGVEKQTPTGLVRRISTTPRDTCNLQITADPKDKYFMGEARRQCVANNKGNLFCQQQCLDKMKLMVYSGSWDRMLGQYGRYNCQSADPEVIKAATSANQCYHLASTECAKNNPNQDYCRRKCMENAYALCRQAIAQLRFIR